MKISDISDAPLRAWAESYVDQKLAECRSAKRSSEDLKTIWRTYSERDWEAFKDLLDLRDKAELRGFEREELDTAIGKRLHELPEIATNGNRYSAPYTMAIEVSVLRKLLGIEPPPRSQVTYVDFHS